tara:strand:+ start:351 stop:791 length:441 start_codon:yes stop_codon:yes gene_type:complete
MACAYEAEKGCIGVEYGSERKQIFHYVFKGSARVGKLFSNDSKIIDDSKGKLIDCKDLYGVDTAFEFLEDTEMWGFNVLDDNVNWDAKIVTESKLTITKKSALVCLGGKPTVNSKELIKYDYVDIANGDYTIDLKTDGVLLLFTKT